MAIQDLPLGRFIATKRQLKLFDPLIAEKMFQMYRTSAGLDQGLRCAAAFNNYSQSHAKGLDAFAEIKTPDGSTLEEKLKSTAPQMDVLKQRFADAVAFNANTNKAMATFNQDVATLNKLIAENPPKFSIVDIASHLGELKADATKAITAQHQQEKDEILKLFNTPASLTAFKDAMGLAPDAQVDKFRDDLLSALEKSQKEGLEALNKTIDDEANKLHRVAQSERDRISYLATMWHNNKFMKEKINELAEKRRQEENLPEEETTASIDFHEGGYAIFKGIKVTDMPLLQTITGRKIEYNETDGTFRMELPGLLKGLIYYNTPDQNIDYDIVSLARAVRACGHSKISWSVNYADEDYAMELARRQFEGAAVAGFDPTIKSDPKNPDSQICDIKINVNGKEVAIKKLFESEPNRLEVIMADYKKAQAQRDAYHSKTTNPITATQLKEALAACRQEVPDNDVAADEGNYPPLPPGITV